jgi:hypothetical protein
MLKRGRYRLESQELAHRYSVEDLPAGGETCFLGVSFRPPVWTSRVVGVPIRIIGSSAVNHTKAQMHELSHRRANGAHLGFATRDEPLINRFDVHVVLLGHNCTHEHHSSVHHAQELATALFAHNYFSTKLPFKCSPDI